MFDNMRALQGKRLEHGGGQDIRVAILVTADP
jgi:hypothetical protein